MGKLSVMDWAKHRLTRRKAAMALKPAPRLGSAYRKSGQALMHLGSAAASAPDGDAAKFHMPASSGKRGI